MQWNGLRAFMLTMAVLTSSGAVTLASAQSGASVSRPSANARSLTLDLLRPVTTAPFVSTNA